MAPMQTELAPIADKVRGVASEKRASQERIASVLGISRQAANQRLNAKVPFLAHELSRLAKAFDVPVATFFGEVAVIVRQ